MSDPHHGSLATFASLPRGGRAGSRAPLRCAGPIAADSGALIWCVFGVWPRF